LVVPNRPGQTQQHLAGWMEAHRNMPLADQQRALANEPNFRNLPPQEQQQLHQRLTQLNNMPASQRDKVIEHTEAMERLQPRQRQQVRDAMSQLGSLPEDRQHAVAHAFHQAIAMPEPQRQAWLNSPQVRGQFNDNERDTLNHLLDIQPAAAQAGFSWAKPQAAPQAPRP
jgi:DNA-directed RNA polymerase subunit F